MKELIIYKFCTLGGVEKCVLERALLYRNLPITCYICFLNAAPRMLDMFQRCIVKNNLENVLKVISFEQIKDIKFDMVTSIDTPEVLHLFDEITVECHTSYPENKKYLNKLPDNVTQIFAPSEPFALSLLQEHPINAGILSILPNFVTAKQPLDYARKRWNKRIIFYFGRLDYRKNHHELLKIFQLLAKQSDEFLFYILSPSLEELHQVFSSYKGLRNRTIIMPGLPFYEIDSFLQLMKHHGGIYVSSSKTESFGLTTSEALAHGIPVVVVDNPVNRYITQNKTEYLYSLGAPEYAVEKILYLARYYEQHIPCAKFLTETLSKQHLQKIEGILAGFSDIADRDSSSAESLTEQWIVPVEVGRENTHVN